MKLCDTCIYRNENEYHKPCIVYRDDCEYYEEERDDMTREEITQLNTDYLNDCESEHEMNELFYFVLELLKHEQESSCPYYVIDEDGHGLCKNHRLEQEPSGETVSLGVFKQVMWERDIAIEQLKELGYGFGQKIEPCGDAISRQAVLDGIEELKNSPWATDKRGNGFEYLITEALDVVADLCVKQTPSVNPQEPKTGHWEWIQYDGNPNIGNWHCSECRSIVIESVYKNEKAGIPLYKFCPNCGAKMQKSEEQKN